LGQIQVPLKTSETFPFASVALEKSVKDSAEKLKNPTHSEGPTALNISEKVFHVKCPFVDLTE